jgi:hypothetical protein
VKGEKMSQFVLERLANLASNDLPPDASAEQIIAWTMNFLSDAGASEVLFHVENSLLEEGVTNECY